MLARGNHLYNRCISLDFEAALKVLCSENTSKIGVDVFSLSCRQVALQGAILDLPIQCLVLLSRVNMTQHILNIASNQHFYVTETALYFALRAQKKGSQKQVEGSKSTSAR